MVVDKLNSLLYYDDHGYDIIIAIIIQLPFFPVAQSPIELILD